MSSKDDGIQATKLNLPYAALGYISWFMEYLNSERGPEPYTADPLGMFWWWITWLIPILHIIVVVNMVTVAAERTGYAIGFANSIFMKLLTGLGDLLWLIIRAAVLVLIWILFAITLLFTYIIYFAIMGIVFLLDLILSIEITMDENYICAEGDISISFEILINKGYNDLFDLDYPKLESNLGTNDFHLNFWLDFFNFGISITEFPEEQYSGMFESSMLESSKIESSKLESGLSTSSSNSSNRSVFDDFCDLISGIGLMMSVIGSIVGLYSGLLAFASNEAWKNVIYIVGIIIFVVILGAII